MSTATRARAFGVVVAVVLVAAGIATGTTYVISPDGLGDYPTIQAAVNAATDGDIIELTDGTFRGDGNRDIAVPSRHITIRSQSGDYLDCIIDCEGSARAEHRGAEHRGFRFETAVGSGNVTLEHIAIINGYVTENGGGGIWIIGASPTISSCAIWMCTAAGSAMKGGGIYVSDGGNPYVSWCLISQNTADYGGGIAVSSAAGMFQSCDVTDNEATNTGGGVYVTASGITQFLYSDIVSNTAPRAGGVRMAGTTPYILHCNVSRNDATAGHSGGVWLQGGHVNFCTIVENSATEGGGGVYCLAGTGSMQRCIIAFTESGYGVGASEGNAPNMECCDVFGNVDGNYDAEVGDQTGFNFNFSLGPELCDLNNADYRLFDTSPCLEANSPCGVLVGKFSQGCDSPVEEMSWGSIKALYE